MPSLDRAFTLAQMYNLAEIVGQYLEFHMPGIGNEPFEVDMVVAERGSCLVL